MEILRAIQVFAEEILMDRSSLVIPGHPVMIVSQMGYIRLLLKYVMTKGIALLNLDRLSSQISPQF